MAYVHTLRQSLGLGENGNCDMKTKMNLKSSAVGAIFRAVAVVSVIGASTFAASMAVAALTPAQQTAADALAVTVAEAIQEASTGPGDRTEAVKAAIANALAANSDPLVQNAALAAAAKTPAVAALMASIPAVATAVNDVKTTVLAAAIVEAANTAGSDPVAIQAAISDVVATASVSPTIAASAIQQAQNSGQLNSSTTTTVANLGNAVETLVDNNQTGTIQVATTQPSGSQPTVPFYVG